MRAANTKLMFEQFVQLSEESGALSVYGRDTTPQDNPYPHISNRGGELEDKDTLMTLSTES